MILRDLGASVPRTATLPKSARLPTIVHAEPPLHLGFIVAVLLCVLVWFILRRTTFGFEVRTIGANPHAARYAGMGVNRTIILVMAISGAFAGMAGASEITGTSGFLSPGVFVGIGFDAIAIALLARANPFGIILMLDPVGVDALRRRADAAGERPVDRRGAHHPGAGAAVRGRRRDRPDDLPRRRSRAARRLETTPVGSGWGGT